MRCLSTAVLLLAAALLATALEAPATTAVPEPEAITEVRLEPAGDQTVPAGEDVAANASIDSDGPGVTDHHDHDAPDSHDHDATSHHDHDAPDHQGHEAIDHHNHDAAEHHDQDADHHDHNATDHHDHQHAEHDHQHAEHDNDHAAENGTDGDWAYRAENTTELVFNATDVSGNFTTELPGNVTGPTGNGSSTSLSCFVCNSATEPVCADPFSEPAAEAAGLLEECPAVSGLRTVCRKSWQMVPGDTRVIRSCGHDNDPRTCFVTAEAVTASHVCHCYEDACNAAPDSRMAAAALLLAIASTVRTLHSGILSP